MFPSLWSNHVRNHLNTDSIIGSHSRFLAAILVNTLLLLCDDNTWRKSSKLWLLGGDAEASNLLHLFSWYWWHATIAETRSLSSPHVHICALVIVVLLSHRCWMFVVNNSRRLLFLRGGRWTGDGVLSTLSRHLFVPLLALELLLLGTFLYNIHNKT